jgi:hypothetical protein
MFFSIFRSGIEKACQLSRAECTLNENMLVSSKECDLDIIAAHGKSVLFDDWQLSLSEPANAVPHPCKCRS